MMESFTAITTLVCLAGLFVLFFWLYRDYRLDLFRDRLFELRNTLFDLADAGEISFDHASYGMLRSSINGTIRHGHRFGLLNLIAITIAVRGNEPVKLFHDQWVDSLRTLPDETREKIRSVRMCLHYLVIEQLIFTSPILMLMVIPAVLWLVLKRLTGALENAAKRLREVAGDALINGIVDRWDIAAIAHSGADN